MKIRQLGDQDGFSEITVWQSLKVRVPDALRRPVIAPRHTVVMGRLISTAMTDLRHVLDRSLGISDPAIVENLRTLLAASRDRAG
jgi:hypothetical protein